MERKLCLYVYELSGMTPVIFFFFKATENAAKALIWSVKIGTGTSCPFLGASVIWATAECVIFVIVSVNPSQYAVSHLTFPINGKLRVWVMFFIWRIERFMNFCLPPNGPNSTWIYNITHRYYYARRRKKNSARIHVRITVLIYYTIWYYQIDIVRDNWTDTYI